jgi:flagellar hook-basal body complex protein FliE
VSIEPIGFLPPSVPLAPYDSPEIGPAAGPATPAPTDGTSAFGRWFTQQVGEVNGKIAESDRQLQALASGEAQNLHQVMISLEDARLSFQLLAQVRNRVLEAYQDIMRMQL